MRIIAGDGSMHTRMWTIRGVTLVDPVSGVATPSGAIQIEGERIHAIRGSPADPPLAADLDGAGLYAIPGLIDTHVHALGALVDELPALRDLFWVPRQHRRNLRAFLEAGVTLIRDMGAPLHLVRRLSRQAARGAIASPRILFAGPLLTVPGGYPYFIPPAPRLFEWIAGPMCVGLTDGAHAAAIVDRLAGSGVACIKVAYQSARYDDARSPLPVLSRDLLLAVLERAHARGVPVALHHVYRADLLQVADLPFDSIEHLPIDGPLTDEEARVVARGPHGPGRPVSTTLMTYGIIDHIEELAALLDDPGERFEPRPLAFLRHALAALRAGTDVSPHIGGRVIATGSVHMRANLARLRSAGATIVCGTDSGGAITPPGCPHWELEDMVRAGLTPLEALRTATCDAARALGLDDVGTLREGARADIVLLGANPLEEIRALADVRAVVQSGTVKVRRDQPAGRRG